MAKKPHPDRPFVDSLVIRLMPIGAASARNMFGGHGLFMEGNMFVLIAGGALYLKGDDGNRADFEAAGMTAFKPYVGHMLAASGIVESICLLLAIKNQTVPATLHTRPKQVQLPVPLATSCVEREIRTALKLSTGFTGHDAALVFARA